MTITELSNLLDIHHRAFKTLDQSGLIIVSKFGSANLEECEYLIKDPVENTYLEIVCKNGEFVVCGDSWPGCITLTYRRLLALTYVVDYLNTMLHLKLEKEDTEGEDDD